MLFMFNSLDERIDIQNHPKYHIVLNNVSKHGDAYNIDDVEKNQDNSATSANASLSIEKRITDIKSQLKEGAKNFHLLE